MYADLTLLAASAIFSRPSGVEKYIEAAVPATAPIDFKFRMFRLDFTILESA